MPKSSQSLVYVDDFNEGLRTDISEDKAPKGSLVRAENVRWIAGGGFYLRRGSQEVTAWTPSTSAKIDNMEPFRELDVLFVQSGTKLFQTVSEEDPLYSVGLTLTAGNRCAMREYNGQMFASNGVDPYTVLTVGRVLTQFSQADASIVMEAGYTDLFRTPKTNTFTADGSTDTLTAPADHTLSNGDQVAFTTTTTLPGGLSTLTQYFVRNKTNTTFQVSLTPYGAIVDITSAGTGTHTFTDGILLCKGQMITYTKKKSQTFTADANDLITSAGHLLKNGSIVLVSSTVTLPAGLSANTPYFVVNATTDTFQLSVAEEGTPVDISDAGTGVHTFRAVKGGDTFLGCTIPSETYEAGSIVTQTFQLVNGPKATVLESVFEKMTVSGISPARHAIYYSETASPAEPENIFDFTNPDNRELFGKYGRVTAMKTLLTKMYVGKDKGIEAWTGLDSDGIPVRDPFTDAYGIENAACFIEMGDRLAMFTTQKRFKTIEPDTTGVNPEPVINPYFDAKIEGTLRQLDDDQSGASMGYNERDTLMRATVLQDVRKTLIYDTAAKNWSVDTGITPNCWCEFKGRMYFGSATTDKIFKAESMFRDGKSNPRLDVLTPVHYVGDRRRKVHVGHVYLTGRIGRMSTAEVEVFIDGVFARDFDINGAADYVATTGARPVGREYLGRDALGFSGDDDPAAGFHFTVPIDINAFARNVQLRIVSQSKGGVFQIDSYDIVEGDEESSSDTQEDIR